MTHSSPASAVSAVSPESPEPRLRELAKEAAHRLHRIDSDDDGYGCRNGHKGYFKACRQVDCRLVREGVALVSPREPEVQIAEKIARRAHAGQVDKAGAPYIEHVERVVAAVYGDDQRAVAWLHDVVEDCDFSFVDLAHEGISNATRRAVQILTREESDTYAEYTKVVLDSENPLALAVKIADLRDHLQPNCPPSLRPRYEKALELLTGVLVSPHPPTCPFCLRPLEHTGWVDAKTNSVWWCEPCQKRIEISPYEAPMRTHSEYPADHPMNRPYSSSPSAGVAPHPQTLQSIQRRLGVDTAEAMRIQAAGVPAPPQAASICAACGGQEYEDKRHQRTDTPPPYCALCGNSIPAVVPPPAPQHPVARLLDRLADKGDFPMPRVVLEDDGDLGFDWGERGDVSISLRVDGTVGWSLLVEDVSGHGRFHVDDPVWPSPLLIAIAKQIQPPPAPEPKWEIEREWVDAEGRRRVSLRQNVAAAMQSPPAPEPWAIDWHSWYQQESRIVDTVWAALGISTMEQAGGKDIGTLVSDLRAERTRCEALIAEWRARADDFGASRVRDAATVTSEAWNNTCANELETILAAAGSPQTCVWDYDERTDSYETSCGERFLFLDGGIAENKAKFCQYCGKSITQFYPPVPPQTREETP